MPTAHGTLLHFQPETVYGLVDYAWMGLGASFGPAVIAALAYARATRHGIIYGMIIGGATATLWPLLNISMPSMIPAFALNALVIGMLRKK